MKDTIRLFEQKHIRAVWDEDKEEWFYSIIDVVAALTENTYQNARNYWKVLKHRLLDEGNQTVTDCNRLKLKANDGKYRLTDVGTTPQILRLVQSIPSKKAEPFKIWLAKVGTERMDEIADPEKAIHRALNTYLRKGHTPSWVNQRLKSIEIRKELTDEWRRVGIKKYTDYGILTNEIMKTWSGKTVKEYKRYKDLKKENLRDNMSNMELVLTMLSEETTKEISEQEEPQSFEESKEIAKEGGEAAKAAKDRIEKRLKRSIVTSENAYARIIKSNKKVIRDTVVIYGKKPVEVSS